MEKGYLVLKRASASRSSGEWSDGDYDVLADGVVVGRILVSKAHLDPFSVATRFIELRRCHQRARRIAGILMNVTRDLSEGHPRSAFGHEMT
jgi:hypothetical protein